MCRSTRTRHTGAASAHHEVVNIAARLAVGGIVGGLFMLAIDATATWRNQSCAEGDPPSCMSPDKWSWNTVHPLHLLLGALAGAALLAGLTLLERRVDRRRRSWGEQ
jgi:hypothetical protein